MKIALVLTLILLSFCGYSQTDTLNSFFNFNATDLIQSPNGGYVSGNNGYGDKEKLQAFIPDTNYSVLGALVWLGNIKRNAANPSNSKVWLKMRRFDASPVASVPFVVGPKEVLDSAWFALDSLRADSTFENGWNYLPFNTPIFAGQPYGMSLSFENLESGDTCAIRHSVEDSVLAAGNSWEIWNGSWRRMIDNWALNIDFAIFPVIDSTLNAVLTLNRFDVELFPNPASDELTFSLPEFMVGSRARIAAYSADGKFDFEEDRIISSCQTTCDIRKMKSGYYLLMVSSDSWLGVSRLIVRR